MPFNIKFTFVKKPFSVNINLSDPLYVLIADLMPRALTIKGLTSGTDLQAHPQKGDYNMNHFMVSRCNPEPYPYSRAISKCHSAFDVTLYTTSDSHRADYGTAPLLASM